MYNLGMLVLVSALTRLLPWISPKDFQVDTFRSTYRPLMLFIFLLVYCIHAATLWAGLGHVADAGKIIGVMFCLGYIYFGNALGKIRRNFFIGVITPWTLTNQRVWYATHRFASRVWLLAGLLGLVLVSFGFNLSFTATLLVSLYGTKLYSLCSTKSWNGAARSIAANPLNLKGRSNSWILIMLSCRQSFLLLGV